MNTVAIIPARGGSKGLPQKNILPLAGKPLIVHTIEAATTCPLIERCLVTTEDAEIKKISQAAGAEVIDRPAELALDNTPTEPVIKHALEYLVKADYNPQYFALLQATSPLRTGHHLECCLQAFWKSGAASAVSVTEFELHPYKGFKYINDELVPLFGREFLTMPRQQLPTAVCHNGAIYLGQTEKFLNEQSFFIEPVFPFLMDKTVSIDIDTAEDLLMAELLLKFVKKREHDK